MNVIRSITWSSDSQLEFDFDFTCTLVVSGLGLGLVKTLNLVNCVR